MKLNDIGTQQTAYFHSLRFFGTPRPVDYQKLMTNWQSIGSIRPRLTITLRARNCYEAISDVSKA